eukprot:1188274-Prorocentrum_minimum.AAC.3
MEVVLFFGFFTAFVILLRVPIEEAQITYTEFALQVRRGTPPPLVYCKPRSRRSKRPSPSIQQSTVVDCRH